jgi:hypothetical protein
MNPTIIHQDNPPEGFIVKVYFFEELNVVAKRTRMIEIKNIPKAPSYDDLQVWGGTKENRDLVREWIFKTSSITLP